MLAGIGCVIIAAGVAWRRQRANIKASGHSDSIEPASIPGSARDIHVAGHSRSTPPAD